MTNIFQISKLARSLLLFSFLYNLKCNMVFDQGYERSCTLHAISFALAEGLKSSLMAFPTHTIEQVSELIRPRLRPLWLIQRTPDFAKPQFPLSFNNITFDLFHPTYLEITISVIRRDRNQYDPGSKFVVVASHAPVPGSHCMYVIRKNHEIFECRNSWGNNQPLVSVPGEITIRHCASLCHPNCNRRCDPSCGESCIHKIIDYSCQFQMHQYCDNQCQLPCTHQLRDALYLVKLVIG